MAGYRKDTSGNFAMKGFTELHRALDALFARPGRLRLLIASLALAALPLAGPQAAETPDAGAFLTDLNERVIAQLTGADIQQAEREQRFRVLLGENFSVRSISRFVLGRYWRKASEQERAAFIEVFEDVLVQRFAPLFVKYSGETLTVGQVRPNANNPNSVTVTSQLKQSHGAVVKVDWRMRNENGHYKIVDIVTEGVSIAISLRSVYGSFILRNGGRVDALIDDLRSEVAAAGAGTQTAQNTAAQ